MDDELRKIREAQEQQKVLEELKKEILRKVLTKKAIERLGRVRIANPQLAAQIELYLVQLYQTGQLKEMVTEEKLKTILSLLTKKRDFRIRRR
jgi:programmed cell death protein 5